MASSPGTPEDIGYCPPYRSILSQMIEGRGNAKAMQCRHNRETLFYEKASINRDEAPNSLHIPVRRKRCPRRQHLLSHGLDLRCHWHTRLAHCDG